MPNSNKSLKKIKIHFILDPAYSSEDESSSAMQECYEECVSNKLLVDWVKDPMDPKHNFTKNHIFVFEKFGGDFYEKIVASKTCFRVVGPYCLFTCMSKSLPIPQVPTLTMAMDQLIISFSCLSKEIKTDLTAKVKLMGGVVNSSLLETTTHLVVGKAYSPKYEKANERGMNVMTPGWIDAVFTASQHSGLTHASDYEFNKHKCPVFYNLAFSVSGYGSKKKESFRKLIESHGGRYYGSLQYQVTDLLICEKSEGEKYKAAREWGLPCVAGHWLTDSAEVGYSMPVTRYAMSSSSAIKCSTPTKDGMPSKFHNSDISISMIQENSHPSLSSHPRTVFPNTPSSGLSTPALTPIPYDYAHAVECLDLGLAKRSDAFLDGCNIYLSGFEPGQEEKLRRLIKLGCGVRFTEPDESVTHVVMGAFSPAFHKLYSELGSKPPVVRVTWLHECMLSKAPCPETPFLCFAPRVPSSSTSHSKAPDCPSPLSKKGLQMLISPAKPRPSPAKQDRDSPTARKLLQDYLDSQHAATTAPYHSDDNPVNPNQKEPPPNQKERPHDQPELPLPLQSDETAGSSSPEYFTGLMFLVLGFTEEEMAEIADAIREASGKVVNNPKTFHGIPDYVIVPFEGYSSSVVPTEDIVTDIWLMECKQLGSVVDVQYYHRPTQVTACATPLVNCVITISNYVGFERDFLARLSQLLGAGYQEEFMKRDNPRNGKKASTHLVCPSCSGSKYNAAIKWGFPSVSKRWLLECARTGTRLPEDRYLTGCDEGLSQKSEIPPGTPNIPQEASKIPSEVTNIPSGVNKQPCTSSIPNGLSKCPNGRVNGREISGASGRLTNGREGSNAENPAANLALDTKENQVLPGEDFHDEAVGLESASQQSSQGFQPKDGGSKKRKLCVLNNVETGDAGVGSPLKRTALDNSRTVSQNNHIPPPHSQSRSFSQSTKPSTRAERKQWEKLMMDNLAEDQDRMLPPKACMTSANTRVEAWVAGNERQASDTHSSQQTSQPRSMGGSQPSDLVKTIDELNLQIDRASRDSRGSEDTGGSPPKHRVGVMVGGGSRKYPQEESQPRVGWEDYVETMERKSKHGASSEEDARCFVLSNVSDELKVRYSDIVSKLGGCLLNTSQCFQPQTTHLIMESPLRSEKLLCCLASGKWILSPRYLEDSQAKNMFLPEQEYEFGNPFSSDKMPRLEGPVVQYAQAAHRWRLKRGGAFTGMRATLFVAEKRLDSLRRLIQAGGGIVLHEKDALKGSHCFWEDTRVDMPVNLEDFARAGVFLLPPVYLADYLRQEPPPQPEDCLIEHYRALYEKENQ